jgi:tetratricopeptide (TPR) repeat protein
MRLDPIALRIDRLLAILGTAPVPPSTELAALFASLRADRDPAVRDAAEARIWSIWCRHDEARATRAMERAIQALGSGDLTEAGRVLDALVQEWPAWPEAWNKRATLRFIEGRDADSLADIEQTLILEPRHFGAVSGFAQICMRAGNLTAALTAFEHVLNINPRQEGVRRAVEMLRPQASRTLH